MSCYWFRRNGSTIFDDLGHQIVGDVGHSAGTVRHHLGTKWGTLTVNDGQRQKVPRITENMS